MRARRVEAPHQALRGWLLAVSSTGLAIAAHGAAGGSLSDTALTIPLTALIAWGAAALGHRLRSVVTLTCVLGLIQLTLHRLLTESVSSHVGHPPEQPAVSGWAMFAGHTLATLFVAALLAGASSALVRMSAALAWLRGRLRVLLSVPVAAPATIGVPSVGPVRPGQLLEVHLRRVRSRRGPPARS